MGRMRRRRLVEEAELLRDPRKFSDEYGLDEELSVGRSRLTPEISTAQEDDEVGLYVEHFLDEMSEIPEMPRLNLADRQGALEALSIIQEHLDVLSQHQKTAAALQRLLNSKLGPEQ